MALYPKRPKEWREFLYDENIGPEALALLDYSTFLGHLASGYGEARKTFEDMGKNISDATTATLVKHTPMYAMLDDIYYRLNHFIPAVKCSSEKCDKTAANVTVLYLPRENDFKMGAYDNFYCGKCTRNATTSESREESFPLDFDTVRNIQKKFADVPKKYFAAFIPELNRRLTRSAGWPAGKTITADGAHDFVQALKLTSPSPYARPEQLKLF